MVAEKVVSLSARSPISASQVEIRHSFILGYMQDVHEVMVNLHGMCIANKSASLIEM